MSPWHELENIVLNYKIFVDTSALMAPNSEKFFLDELRPLLLKYNKKVYIPRVVIKELQKHMNVPEKSSSALKGIKIIEEYIGSNIADIRYEETDYIPDQVFQYIVSKFKLKYNLAFITNDKQLARDLRDQHSSLSVKTDKLLRIISIDLTGEPVIDAEQLKIDLYELGDISETPINISYIPEEGDEIRTLGQIYRLGRRVSEGGEGRIYLLEGNENFVVKIFLPEKLTLELFKKIEVMVKNKDKIPASRNFSIAWPEDLVYNRRGEFVGYVMRKMKGVSLLSVLHPQIIKNKYQFFKRLELVRIAKNVLEALDCLHDRGIFMGDINLRNILVNRDCHVSLIDTDSYQFGPFKCKVGRPEFTHRDRLGREYSEFFREPKDEMFGMAILVFMILMVGRHPYTHVGEVESITENIRKGYFPYRVSSVEGTSYENTPVGPWAFIWSHIPLEIKEFLALVFTYQKEPRSSYELRVMTKSLIEMLKRYEKEIESGKRLNELFPRYWYIPLNMEKYTGNCPKCGHYFELHKNYYEQIKHKKEILCPYCHKMEQIVSKMTPKTRSLATTKQVTVTAKNDEYSAIKTAILGLIFLFSIICLPLSPAFFMLLILLTGYLLLKKAIS